MPTHPLDPGFDLFPVSDYYKPHIRDAVTISRQGSWWSAALLIEDPKNAKLFCAVYRWQKVGGVWKQRGKLMIRKRVDLDKCISVLAGWGERLQE